MFHFLVNVIDHGEVFQIKGIFTYPVWQGYIVPGKVIPLDKGSANPWGAQDRRPEGVNGP